MIECLKFDLNGNTAFFKNPEINNDVNITYSNIHKIVILGMIGAVIGLNGRQQSKQTNKIEFYEVLRGLEVSIVPHSPYFSKTYTIFNNSAGFANESNKHGATQNIKQQWLTNPKWTTYIKQGKIDNDTWEDIKECFLQNKCVYDIYLGGKPHIANISNVEIIEIDKVNNIEDIYKINSLVKYDEIIDIDSQVYENCNDEYSYCLKEYLPVNLNKKGLYIVEKILYTNYEIYEVKNTNNFYKYNNNILYFM